MLLYLASPRGFCAGVQRAIDIVNIALETYGLPLYVLHEIVHNKRLVKSLEAKGVIFVENIEEIPQGARAILSAHGSPKIVTDLAMKQNLRLIDATCPLVTSVHRVAHEMEKDGTTIILIGHANHPEVIGTMGQVEVDMILIENIDDAERVEIADPDNVGIVTQTTLNFADTQKIIDVLQRRFPKIKLPKKSNICYATQNRQHAVSAILPKIDILIVVGSENSSNSTRLKVMGELCRYGSYLIDDASKMSKEWFRGVNSIGVSAGASAPDWLFDEVLYWIRSNFSITEEYEEKAMTEEVVFALPKELR